MQILNRILSCEQAAAVYGAMEALYDVGGALTQVFVPNVDTTGSVAVTDHGERGISVAISALREHYADWGAFRDAYAVDAYRAR